MLTARSHASINFSVDDVVPINSILKTCKPLDAVRALLDAPPGRFAADESSQGNPTHGRLEACWNYSLDCIAEIGHHPLIAAAHLAFSNHLPLVLSPDVIWVTIIQGLAQHIRLNPEKHRAFLVNHQGKRELTVIRSDLHRRSPENPWAEVIAQFSAQIHEEIGDLAECLLCDFSTTGPLERTVSEVALLDVLQPYFSYHVVAICGIPSVTLEGTQADWQKLRQKVELLAPFDLDWWLDELRPICDQFARAAAGDVDRPHWQRLYKIQQVYGAEVINGWIGKLFPYTKDFDAGTYSNRNALLDPEVEAEIRKLEAEDLKIGREKHLRFDAPGISAEELPRGLSQVPFTLTDQTDKRAMEFVAGPIAVTRNDETGSLRPTLGWAVRESPPIEQAVLRLAEHKLEPAKEPLSWAKLRQLGAWYMPTDVVRFYRAADSAMINGENGQPLWRVLPLSDWLEPQWAQIEYEGNRKVLRFAEASDGTELVIQLYCSEDKHVGGVFIGHRNGAPIPETGTKVARSFTDFLLKALESRNELYFRRENFLPCPL